MSITYTITTNFGAKDALPDGDPNKIIRGSEFTTEFNSIKTALSLAAPAASPTFTGTATFSQVDINGGALDGVTIGASSAGAGSFTTVDATGAITGASFTTTGAATVDDLTVNGLVNEQQFALTPAATVDIDPANGTLQYITLDQDTTFTESLSNGDYVTVMIKDGTDYTATWPASPGFVWVGGAAPALDTAKYTIIELFQVNSVVYGALVGAA